MTLTLTLSPDLRQRLAVHSAEQGLTVEEYALRLLEAHVPQSHLTAEERRKKLAEAIEFWINDDDPEEQRETGEYLIRALNESRAGGRLLFPEELKGITW
jgi:hypothetical protein